MFADEDIEEYILASSAKKFIITDWDDLSSNPAAIHLINEMIETTPDKINWDLLSSNSAATHLLEANPDKICWHNVGIINDKYTTNNYYLQYIKPNNAYILK